MRRSRLPSRVTLIQPRPALSHPLQIGGAGSPFGVVELLVPAAQRRAALSMHVGKKPLVNAFNRGYGDLVPMSQDEPPIATAEIRQRAYELWERNHRPDGFEIEFWVMAERELRAERQKRPTQQGKTQAS